MAYVGLVMCADRALEGLDVEGRRALGRLNASQRKRVERLSIDQRRTLAEMVFLMGRCMPLRGSELVGRLAGPLTGEEIWSLIELAAREGIIERARMVAPASRLVQRWRLVGGSRPDVASAYL